MGDSISPATRWGRVGLEICYDLRFPVARSLALQDADFLVTVAQFPAQRRSSGGRKSARAIENQIPTWPATGQKGAAP